MKEFLEGKIAELKSKFAGYDELVAEINSIEAVLAEKKEALSAFGDVSVLENEIEKFVELGRAAGFNDGIFYVEPVVAEEITVAEEVVNLETPIAE